MVTSRSMRSWFIARRQPPALRGGSTEDAVIEAAAAVQQAISNAVAAVGAGWLVVALLGLLGVVGMIGQASTVAAEQAALDQHRLVGRVVKLARVSRLARL